jgi:hypothetical protein
MENWSTIQQLGTTCIHVKNMIFLSYFTMQAAHLESHLCFGLASQLILRIHDHWGNWVDSCTSIMRWDRLHASLAGDNIRAGHIFV